MHLRSLLRNGLQFSIRHRGAIVLSLFIVISVVGIFGSLHPALAQEGVTGAVKQAIAYNVGTPVALMLDILTTILSYISAGLAKITLLIMEMLIVPILNYNGFSSSPIIGLGWSLVRDVMNMFVIVVLIVIAIFTIVGNHRAQWEQQLPQLFIAVVFMNFSRTICGIFIDISQVIMFTFVNALLDIAAGNFVQLLSLESFGKYNPMSIDSQLNQGINPIDPFKQFVEAFLQVPLYGSILAILLLLALAFLYRIVVLWVLVIMSPLTFFLGGIKGIFHGAEHSAAQWWGKFTGALMMGPILAFFLWLALAAASNGTMASSENFTPAPEADTYFSIEALNSSHLTSLLLALILLTVGMQVAGEQSQKIGGYASQLISEGMGNKVVGGSLKLPFQAGAAMAREPLSRANRIVGEQMGTKTFTEGVGQGLVRAGGAISAVPFVGGFVGQGLTAVGGRAESYGEHGRKEREKAAEEAFNAKSDTQKMADFEMMRQKKGTFSMEEMRAAEKAHLDKGFREERTEFLTKGLLSKYQQPGRSAEDAEHLAKAEAKGIVRAEYGKTLLTQYDLADRGKLTEAEENKVYSEMSKSLDVVYESNPTVAEKFLKSDKLAVSKMYDKEDIFDRSKNPGLVDLLSQRADGFKKDSNTGELIPIMVTDKARAGQLGDKVYRKMRPTPSASPRPAIDMPPAPGFPAIGELTINNIDPSSSTARDTVRQVMESPNVVDPSLIGAAIIEGLPAADQPAERERIADAFFASAKAQDKEVIVKGIDNGSVDLRRAKAADFDTSTIQGLKMTQAVYESSLPNLPSAEFVSRIPDTDALANVAAAATGFRNTGAVTTDRITAVQEHLLNTGAMINDVVPGIHAPNPMAPPLTKEAIASVSQLVEKDPANLRHLVVAVPVGTKATDITRLVVENISPDAINQIARKANKATGTALDNLKDTLLVMKRSLEAETSLKAPPAPLPGKAPTRAFVKWVRNQELRDDFEAATRGITL